MEWKRLTKTTVVYPDVAVRLLTGCPPTRLVLTGRRAAASAHARAADRSYRVRTETKRRNSDTSVDSRSVVYHFASPLLDTTRVHDYCHVHHFRIDLFYRFVPRLLLPLATLRSKNAIRRQAITNSVIVSILQNLLVKIS